MSIETPDRAHDPARNDGETDEERGGSDETRDADDSTRKLVADDELTVVVCPQRVYEQLQSELDDSQERLCREYQREYADLLAERARLEDEVTRLERQLRRKESRLDEICTRNEEILAERTESYRKRIDDRDDGDDFVWTGRKQESGLVARVKNWFG